MFEKPISWIISITLIFAVALSGECAVLGGINPYKQASVENYKYTHSTYFTRLSNVKITGNYRDDVIAIAHSQIGYHEGNSVADYDGKNTKGTKDYTEFGRSFKSVGKAWCSEFASWCLNAAGVPTSIVNRSTSANAAKFTQNSKAKYYKWSKTKWGGGKYTPAKGDIILWVWSTYKGTVAYNKSLSHTSVLEKVVENGNGTLTLHVVHGNTSGQVKTSKYTLNASDGKLANGKGYIGYFVAPAYETTVKKYTVSFKSSKGKLSMTSKLLANGGVYGVMPLPKAQDATFMGWFTKKKGGSRVSMYSTCKITKNLTLYAQWKSYVPAKTKIKTIKAKKKGFKVTWKKVKGVKGYKLQYSLKKSMKKAKTVTVKKAKTTSRTIKKLKRKKKYYVRIRTYKVVGKKTFMSGWSKKKAKKTK